MGGGGTRAALGQPDGNVLGVNQASDLEDAIRPLLAPAAEARWVVHVGLAGISRPGRRAACLRTLATLLPAAEVVLTSDAAVALWGALPQGEGVAVVAGTGSIAIAREAGEGREARTGGYGFLVGDEGSAFWLGRAAAMASLAAAEGRGPASCLGDLVCQAMHVRDPRHIPARLYAGRRAVQQLAALAPVVSQAAAAGDRLAQDALAEAGRALSSLAVAAVRGVWPDNPPARLQVATCGGVWQAGQPLLEPFQAALLRELPQAQVVRPALPPVGGALLLACRRGAPAEHGTVARIAAALT